MRFERRGVLVALAAALLASASAPGQAPADPAEPIHLLDAALAGAGDSLPTFAAIHSAVEASFDTGEIARAVLGSYADSATASQFERFRQALVGRIVRQLLNRRRADGRGTLGILRTRTITATEWLMSAPVLFPRRGQRTISWRVRAERRGTRIIDVLGNGTSMNGVLRNEHAAALRRLGLNALIARMEARNQRARS